MNDLVVDVGNSRVKWALAANGRVIGSSRAVAHDNLELLFAEWSRLSAPPQALRGVSGPASAGTQAEIEQWAMTHWDLAPDWLVTPAIGGGVQVAYATPTELGTDRWLAMVGAKAAGQAPACIIDCGSAITLDVLNADGRHQGGLILPGLGAQQTGLTGLAPGLPRVDWPNSTPFLANNTPDALASGYLHGTAMALQGLWQQCAANAPEALPAVLTGGDAVLISRYLDRSVTLRPDLVLEGIAALQ